MNQLEDFRNSFRYKLGWQKIGEHKYLYKEDMNSGKRKYTSSSQETENYLKVYNSKKKSIKESIKLTKQALETRAKLNKYEKINRAPAQIVDILAKINELGLDNKMVVIGTNALYAYEARFNVMIEQSYLSTSDIDILNRRNVKLPLAIFDYGNPLSVVDMLKSVDSSFDENPKVPYQFINKNRLIVELINPASSSVIFEKCRTDPFFDTIQKLDINNIKWLENSRLIKDTIISQTGKMAVMTTIHPIDFAVYKLWLSIQNDRLSQKAERDRTQSVLVTKMLKKYSHFNLNDELSKLKHIKKDVVEMYKNEVLEISQIDEF
jgi:hypothetical protein